MCVGGGGVLEAPPDPRPLSEVWCIGWGEDLVISIFNTCISGDVGEVAGTTLCELMLCDILSTVIDLIIPQFDNKIQMKNFPRIMGFIYSVCLSELCFSYHWLWWEHFYFLTTVYITSLCTGLSLSVWQILSQAGEMGWPFWPSSMPCGRTWLTWTTWGTDPAERICKRPSGSRNTSWRSPNCWSPKVESSSFLWKPPCFKVLHEVDLKQHLCEGDHSNIFSCWKI